MTEALPSTGTEGPLPSMRLDGQTALVTGAGRGIGRACALALAAAGAEIICWSRTAAELDTVVAETEAMGGRARSRVVDVTDDADLADAFSAIDRLDILVNNAGTNVPQHFLEVETEALDRVLGINVRAAFLVAQGAARIMARQKSGAIVNMSSQMGHIGGAKRTVYCTTKFAIEGLTKSMALDLAAHGIRVNAVAPTFIETPMTRPMLDDPAFRDHVLAMIPLGKVGTPADVAGAVVFLASPAAALITGTSLLVDGGWTAR